MVAADRKDLVSGVVLASGYVPPNRAERSWVIGTGSWVKHRGRLAGRFVRGGHLTARQDDREASFFTSLGAVLQMAGVGLRPAAFDAIARTVECPVLAISGGRDSHVPTSWISGAARRYGWSVTVIPEATHFAHVENCRRVDDCRPAVAGADLTRLNDIHSQLNPTTVRRVARGGSVAEIQRVLEGCREEGVPLIAAGGGHAMGGQQFITDGVVLDTWPLDRVDPVRPRSGPDRGRGRDSVAEPRRVSQAGAGRI